MPATDLWEIIGWALACSVPVVVAGGVLIHLARSWSLAVSMVALVLIPTLATFTGVLGASGFMITETFERIAVVLVIVAVTVITVFTDLAFAVMCGIIIAALNFAWQQARQLYADTYLESDGSKLYRVHGTLFFASTAAFLKQFDPAGDPAKVTLDCSHLSFVDYSAIAALDTLRERYRKADKHLRVLHLSERSKKLLKRARVHHE